MASTNIQNANIFYDFIITEQNHTNVILSTRLSYIKVICLFNRYFSINVGGIKYIPAPITAITDPIISYLSRLLMSIILHHIIEEILNILP
jgi:hypothetical protein